MRIELNFVLVCASEAGLCTTAAAAAARTQDTSRRSPVPKKICVKEAYRNKKAVWELILYD